MEPTRRKITDPDEAARRWVKRSCRTAIQQQNWTGYYEEVERILEAALPVNPRDLKLAKYYVLRRNPVKAVEAVYRMYGTVSTLRDNLYAASNHLAGMFTSERDEDGLRPSIKEVAGALKSWPADGSWELDGLNLRFITPEISLSGEGLGPFPMGRFVVVVTLGPDRLNVWIDVLDRSRVRGDYPHPHVKGRSLCWGDHGEQVTNDLYAFRVIRPVFTALGILSTYNSGSPYRRMDYFDPEWLKAQPCPGCSGATRPKGLTPCPGCETVHCVGCRRACICGKFGCSRCMRGCNGHTYGPCCAKKCEKCNLVIGCKHHSTHTMCVSCRSAAAAAAAERAHVAPRDERGRFAPARPDRITDFVNEILTTSEGERDGTDPTV